MTWLIALLGVGLTAFGGWAAVDPASFPAAEFPPFNEHLIHDVAATFLAFGIGLLVAARVPAWRFPVLALAATWNAFHTVAHIVDVDSATSREVGVTTLVEVAVITVVLALLAWKSRVRPA
ncbi:MAG TPA: hypothetical protein VM093_02750 [Aeromicrobium sp.]|nr:hypothetical protein [Aeromicrobium sp.]